jgi:uncharacterized protein (TIGR04255 family)
MEERFETPTAPSVRFEVLEAMPMARFWFLSQDETRLVQVQHDLVVHNWRRMDSTTEYPRYSVLREGLSRYLHDIEEIIGLEEKGALQPNWCEVTYINHIDASSPGSRLALSDVLSMVSPIESPQFLPTEEDAQFASRFRIEEDGAPIGRLTLAAGPAVSANDGREVWAVTLTARAQTSAPTIDAAFARLDLCHEWVVRGFRDSTTARMHQVWGLHEEATA